LTAAVALARLYEGSDSEKAEKYYRLILDQYAGIASSTQVQQAKGALERIKTFGIGKTAPEIEGEDLFGKHFKLSDYRGKVVVIDFWGDW
jgi:hypothetical protein